MPRARAQPPTIPLVKAGAEVAYMRASAPKPVPFMAANTIVPPVLRVTEAKVNAPEEPVLGKTKAMPAPKPTLSVPTLTAPAVPCRG